MKIGCYDIGTAYSFIDTGGDRRCCIIAPDISKAVQAYKENFGENSLLTIGNIEVIGTTYVTEECSNPFRK